VTFEGSSLKEDAPILNLISNRHIGASCFNRIRIISALVTMPDAAAGLISTLQTAEWEDSLQSSSSDKYIPLLVEYHRKVIWRHMINFSMCDRITQPDGDWRHLEHLACRTSR
jgi:hypothetical protein